MTRTRHPGLLLALVVLLAPAWAGASNKDAWAALDRDTVAACTAAAGLQAPIVSPPLRFSDAFGVDVRLLRGNWTQPHLQGREGAMLCLYDRRTKRAEVQAADGWQAPPLESAPTSIRGATWRATHLDGAAVVSDAAITALQPDTTPDVRTYTNGKLTFLHSPASAEPTIRMARGRMAPVPCTRVAP